MRAPRLRPHHVGRTHRVGDADHIGRADQVGRPPLGSIAAAVLVDFVAITGFAVLGRSEHALMLTLPGVWNTAWPFLAALTISWVAVLVWKNPFAPLRAGIPVWIGTLTIGMTLRFFFADGGLAPAFVAVAAGTLLLTLVGWRVVWRFIRIARRRPASAISHNGEMTPNSESTRG